MINRRFRIGCIILKLCVQVAFKMFLGVTADVASWNGDGTAFSLLLYDNPLIGRKEQRIELLTILGIFDFSF